jgi:hypothetical protein
VDALASAVRAGAAPTDLSRALAYAAALRVARFGTANEHADWDSVHHVFTYCNALHGMLTRVCGSGAVREVAIDPRWLRGIFYGAMSVYLIRFLNVPPAALPDERGDPWMTCQTTAMRCERRFSMLSIGEALSTRPPGSLPVT